MASLLGRIGILWSVVAAGVGLSAAAYATMPIVEQELAAYVNSLHAILGSCDIEEFGHHLTPDVEITFEDSGYRRHLTRRTYLNELRQLCRASSPERGFTVEGGSYTSGGSSATVRFLLKKEYRTGLIRPQHIQATIDQETTVQRVGEQRLQVVRIYERTSYRDLRDDRLLPWEEGHPMPPLTQLQRWLIHSWLGPWLTPADRKALVPSQAEE